MKEEIISELKKKMSKSHEALSHELAGIRTGRASTAIFDNLKADYYGTPTPIKQLANFSIPESRLIIIQPWDITQIQAIEKAILTSDIGITPTNDGKVIRIAIPQLNEERRKELVKLARKYAEECKVSMRNVRRDANEAVKKIEKDKKISQDDLKKAQHEIQDLTDKEITKVVELLAKKEAEILEV
ncbi:MAG: ribosome recycling factor [Deltaproteobacteria bacterium]|nr:ribosome recycling factor [Deltaproteobacteria bacterium]